MSGSRFHPYALEEGTNSDMSIKMSTSCSCLRQPTMSRKPPGRSISATATTSHQATHSQKVLSHSTSSTIKNNRLKNGNAKSVPLNKTAPTASASHQTASTPLSSSQAASKPVASRPAASTPVASWPAASIPVASRPATSIPVALRPTPSIPIALRPTPSIPVASRPTPSIPVASQPTPSIPVASRPATSIPVASRPTPSIPVASRPTPSIPPTSDKGSSTPLGTSKATSTPLPVESGSGLAAYPYWSLAQNLFAMEQQQRIQLQQQWRQQLWMQQPNMLYMAGASHEYLRSISQEYLRGTSQEYLRYMNELRHMSVLPLIPTSPATLSYLSPMQNQPLNLSLKDNVKDSTPSSASSRDVSSKPIGSNDCLSPESPECSKEASPKASSPPSLKLHPTKPIQVGSLDPEVAKMFPHLRTTDMGSIVLWNFLWALLADNKYKGIISWIDRPSLKFQVVHPLALARLWGTVKKNKTMNWQKLMKVINLYLSKNILKQGDGKLMFQFILVPQSPDVKTEKDSSA